MGKEEGTRKEIAGSEVGGMTSESSHSKSDDGKRVSSMDKDLKPQSQETAEGTSTVTTSQTQQGDECEKSIIEVLVANGVKTASEASAEDENGNKGTKIRSPSERASLTSSFTSQMILPPESLTASTCAKKSITNADAQQSNLTKSVTGTATIPANTATASAVLPANSAANRFAHGGPGAYALAPFQVEGSRGTSHVVNDHNENQRRRGRSNNGQPSEETLLNSVTTNWQNGTAPSNIIDSNNGNGTDNRGQEGNNNNNSNPTLIEAQAVDDVVEVEAKPIEWWTPQKIRSVIFGTFAVLILIIVTVTAVVVRNQNKNANNTDVETPAPTLPPQERLDAVTNILLTEAYSENYADTARELFQDEQSPQSRALQWIALEDEFHVPLDNVPHLIQRYSLAVLYFATSGESWMESYEFLQPEQECAWSGALTCGSGDGVTVTGLELQQNALAGRLPSEELGFLKDQLQMLDLARNELSGTLPPSMEKLTHLNLARNKFTGSIPGDYVLMSNLQHVDLKMNLLNGTIPEIFRSYSKLTTLDIESNYLTGKVPESMWDLTSIEKLIIESQTKLEGTIPPKIGLWKNVSVFLINMNNGITGSLPTEVGLLTNLVEFKTAQNHMRGPIPSEMGLLTNLKFFALSRNGYEGTIPSELALLSNLHQLYIQSTWLTGQMVEFCEAFEAGDLPYLKTLIADQQEVNCTCCTCCLY